MGLMLNLLILAVLVTASTQQCVDKLSEKLLGMMINQEKLTCYRKAFDPGDSGGCPNVATMKGFNITGILDGAPHVWYPIAADYTTFLAVLACEQYPPDCPVFHQHHDAIFTRDPDVSEEDLTNIFKNLAELHGIHITKFEPVDHTDCDYV